MNPTPDSFLERRLAGEHQALARPPGALVRRPPVVCREHSTVRQALAVMRAEGTGSIVVVDERGHPVGIFTDRDLPTAVLDDRLESPMADVMTRDPLGLPDHTPAYDAVLTMLDHRIRHVLVTEADALVGVVVLVPAVRREVERLIMALT